MANNYRPITISKEQYEKGKFYIKDSANQFVLSYDEFNNNTQYYLPPGSIFRPVRGSQEKIDKFPITNGYVYFATDSGRIYLDKDDERISVGGGAGASIFYAEANDDFEKDAATGRFLIPFSVLEDKKATHTKGDIIVNIVDGSFYSVQEISEDKIILYCIRIATSGGEGNYKKLGKLLISADSNINSILNGDDYTFTISGESASQGGIYFDQQLKVTYEFFLRDSNGALNKDPYYSESSDFFANNYVFQYNAGPHLRKDSETVIVFTIHGESDEQVFAPSKISLSVTTFSLTVAWNTSRFNNLSMITADAFTPSVVVSTGSNRILDFYYDDVLIYTQKLPKSNNTTIINIDEISADTTVKNLDGTATKITLENKFTHGRHKLVAELFLQVLDGQRGPSSGKITMEIGLKREERPLIWFGPFQDTYYEYDTPRIPFRVYDPFSTDGDAHYHLYENGVDILDGADRTHGNNDASYAYWEITGLEAGKRVTYAIRVGQDEYETWERFTFTVLTDPRNMKIVQDALIYNFDARGRSNSEAVQRRSVLKVNGQNATFNDRFNWYNNGWVSDSDHQTCLRISNGASITFPIGKMAFSDNQSHTLEFRMKIRNVQSYDKIITTYTRYKVMENPVTAGIDKTWTDDEIFADFLQQRTTGYASYDAYLAAVLPEKRKTDATIPTYDDLEFASLYRDYNLAAAAIKYIKDGVADNDVSKTAALCLGAQDGYFSNGVESVSIDYVEDQILNLSVMFERGSGDTATGNNYLMKFFVNGILTSVARAPIRSRGWTIDSDNIIFNSSSCDIDLYRFRVYNKALSYAEVLQNQAYDRVSPKEWDLINITRPAPDLNENYLLSYNEMLRYNREHPEEPIMPYMLITTDAESETVTKGYLPWTKEYKINSATVDFVNTGLDAAYASGDLKELFEKEHAAGTTKCESVDEYYTHHAPSWTATGVTLQVQGTSSEFYPRRNYKAKTKGSSGMFQNKGPYEKSYEEYLEKSKITASEEDQATAKDLAKILKTKMFYFDNDVVGTNKFTLKVDYMESSGTYNMGLANLVKTAYSKHPLDDYNKTKALCVVEKVTTSIENLESNYNANTVYYYYSHKGDLKNTKDNELNSLSSAEDFALGPRGYGQKIKQKKVLGGIGEEVVYSDDALKSKIKDKLEECTNVWYVAQENIKDYIVPDTDAYRTSVQGFPILMFHTTKARDKDGTGEEPVFIGRYNMLLDKGSAEAYGFDVDDACVKYVDHTPIGNIAECWEFENNSRGFCSFRDPWKRKELSFAAPEKTSVGQAQTAKGAPIVADSFEYRYSCVDDYLDYLYDLNKSAEDDNIVNDLKTKFGIDIKNNIDSGRQKLLELYSNWERAVQWVWSTATDADIEGYGSVPQLGSYNIVDVAEALYEPDKYWYYNMDAGQYQLASDDFDANEVYYIKESHSGGTESWAGIKLTNNEKLVYKPNQFYIMVNKNYVLATDDEFDSSAIYYQLIVDTSLIDDKWKLNTPVTYGITTYEYDTQEYRLAKFKNELAKHFDLEYLVTYFIITEVLECYDSRGKNAMFASWGPQEQDGDYIWYPIFYDMDTQLGINNTGLPSFDYDIDATEEGMFSTNDSVLWNNLYACFKNAIIEKYEQLIGADSSNFGGKLSNPPFISVANIEGWYKAEPTYSSGNTTILRSLSMRGERPLMAINLDEQYKYIAITNDSWGNRAEDGTVETGYVGSNPSVPNLQTDTSDTYFYALQGARDLSRQQFLINRLNYIDSWLGVRNFKRGGDNRIRSRVSANNPKYSSDQWVEGTTTVDGLIQNQPYWTNKVKEGDIYDSSKTYYKGEKTTNSNRSILVLSPYTYNADTWNNDIKTGEGLYYKGESYQDAQKTHLFDGEYWIDMTPTRKMYVTVGTDVANFPSKKYNGAPVRFETEDLENGVRTSGNYREQLYYVYGLDQMKSLGDLSRLYFQEFVLSGDASKMVDLRLGYDGLDEANGSYLNQGVNEWTIPAGISSNGTSKGMPLLQEVNLSNIRFKNNVTFDFSSCEKLRDFRDTGSNITKVTFAEGVALDTLYLSNDTSELKLVEPRMLTELVENYESPIANSNGKLIAKPGLYIQGLTDGGTTPQTEIITLDIRGGGLGYNSYKLLQKYYNATKDSRSVDYAINLTNVQWSPYVLITDVELEQDTTKDYFVDNGHYNFRKFNAETDNWSREIKNSRLYVYDESIVEKAQANGVSITNTTLLENLINNGNYINVNNGDSPIITGYLYIENTKETEVDEGWVQENIENKYPGLKIFFAYVNEGYSARFIIQEGDNETLIGTDKISASVFDGNPDPSTIPFFQDPREKGSNFSFSTIKNYKSNFDLLGWSQTNDRSGLVISYDEVWVKSLGQTSINNWNQLKLDQSVKNYTFYAVFEPHYYGIKFYNGDGSLIVEDPNNRIFDNTLDGDEVAKEVTMKVQLDTLIPQPKVIPFKDDSNLDLHRTYHFLGYTDKENGKTPLTKAEWENQYANEFKEYWAIFEEASVYDATLDDDYLTFTPISSGQGQMVGYSLSVKKGIKLSGKITLPTTYNNQPILAIDTGNNSRASETLNGFDHNTALTAIFWSPEKSCQLENINENAFVGTSNLKYFEFSDTIYSIGSDAFYQSNLRMNYQMPANLGNQQTTSPYLKILGELGREAFGSTKLSEANNGTLIINDALTFISTDYCFAYGVISHVVFGTNQLGQGSHIKIINPNTFRQSSKSAGKISAIDVYYNSDFTNEATIKNAIDKLVSGTFVINSEGNFVYTLTIKAAGS